MYQFLLNSVFDDYFFFVCFFFWQEHEREKFAAKCTMLQKKNVEMSKRMEELQEVQYTVTVIFLGHRHSPRTVFLHLGPSCSKAGDWISSGLSALYACMM